MTILIYTDTSIYRFYIYTNRTLNCLQGLEYPCHKLITTCNSTSSNLTQLTITGTICHVQTHIHRDTHMCVILNDNNKSLERIIISTI